MIYEKLFDKLYELFGVTATEGEMDEILDLVSVSGICVSCGTKTKGQSFCDVCNARGLEAYG